MKRILIILFVFACGTGLSYGQQEGETNGRGLSFKPDYQFEGSSLTHWKPFGAADWHAENGELIGKSSDTTASLLVLDQSFQDVTFNTLVKMDGDGETGVLLRLEKTDAGWKGVLVSLKNDESAAYGLVMDDKGREVSRTLLRRAGGMMRVAPPPDPKAANASNDNRQGRPQQPNRGRENTRPVLPIPRPETAFQVNGWNQLE